MTSRKTTSTVDLVRVRRALATIRKTLRDGGENLRQRTAEFLAGERR